MRVNKVRKKLTALRAAKFQAWKRAAWAKHYQDKFKEEDDKLSDRLRYYIISLKPNVM